MPKVGRPRGVKPETSKELDKVADMIVSKQVKTANAAMIKIIKSRGVRTSDINNDRRTLQRGWKNQKVDRLAAARERYLDRSSSRSATASSGSNANNGAAFTSALGISKAAMATIESQLAGVHINTADLVAQNYGDIFGAAAAAQKAIENFHIPDGTLGAMKALEKQLGESSAFGQLQAAQREVDRINMMINPLGYKR